MYLSWSIFCVHISSLITLSLWFLSTGTCSDISCMRTGSRICLCNGDHLITKSTNTYCSAKNTVVCFLTILNWFLNEILNTIKKFNTSISRKYFEYTYIFKTLFSRFSVMKSCWFWQPNEVIFSLSSTKMRKDYIAVYLNKVSSVLVLRFYLAVSRNLGLSDLKH